MLATKTVQEQRLESPHFVQTAGWTNFNLLYILYGLFYYIQQQTITFDTAGRDTITYIGICYFDAACAAA